MIMARHAVEMPAALDRVIADCQVVAVCGPGGVGKTTIAATIAVAAARRGTACVITIDPARRLAQTLGISNPGDGPHTIDLGGGGRVDAVSLDAKRTFDALVAQYAPSEEACDRILANRLYQELSSTVSGSHEYAAVERLVELHEAGDYNTIVLDTPPSRQAVDFLDAPGRVTKLIDGRALRALRRDGDGRTGRAVGSASKLVRKTVERLLGESLVGEVTEFAAAFDGMYDGFRDRAAAARALLESPASTFVTVTTPDREPLDDLPTFHKELERRQLELGFTVMNRIHPSPLEETASEMLPPEDLGELRRLAEHDLTAASVPSDVRAHLTNSLLFVEQRARVDRQVLDDLRATLIDRPILVAPLLVEAPTNLAALSDLADILLGQR